MDGEYILKVLADGFHRNSEEFGNELLGEPDSFILVAHFQTPLSGLSREDEKLRRAIADLFFSSLMGRRS